MTLEGRLMCSSEKKWLKEQLADTDYLYSEAELESIINQEFFGASEYADMEVIDLASMRLAKIRGLSANEQFSITANSALKKLLASFGKE